MERDWTDGSSASLAGATRALDSFGPALIARLRLGQVLQLDDAENEPLAAPLLRARQETRTALLGAATGYDQEHERQRTRAAGFAHHLSRPVDMAALVRILQSAAKGA